MASLVRVITSLCAFVNPPTKTFFGYVLMFIFLKWVNFYHIDTYSQELADIWTNIEEKMSEEGVRRSLLKKKSCTHLVLCTYSHWKILITYHLLCSNIYISFVMFS